MNLNFSHSCKLRVRYSETDQMGYCYYGNYAQYFEVGRVEAMRSLGWSYRKMEESGVMMPVTEFSIQYKMPAKYDDELEIITYIKKISGVRIEFYYEIYNQNTNLICFGTTILVFMNNLNRKPIPTPSDFKEALLSYQVI